MAESESIGGVSVQISGDTSQLNTAFTAAQSTAAAAGQKVAAAFSSGAGAVDGLTAAVEGAAAAQTAFAGATETANAALGHQVSQLQATGGAIRVALGEQSIRAVERFLTLIPGLGTALQYAFPVIGLIALIDAIGHAISKVIGLKEAEAELKSATEAADAAFAHFEKTADQFTVEHITAEFGKARGIAAQGFFDKKKLADDQEALQGVTDHIGILQKAQATAARVVLGLTPVIGKDFLKAEADQVKALQQNARELGAQILEDKDRISKADEDTKRAGQEQGGQSGVARINNEIAADAHLAAQQKAYSDEAIQQVRATASIAIAGMLDRKDAAVATAAVELAVTQASQKAITAALAEETPKRIALIQAEGRAQSAGKSGPEQSFIAENTQTKAGDAQADADTKSLAAHKAVVEAQTALDVAYANRQREEADGIEKSWITAYDAVQKKARETFIVQNLPAAVQTLSDEKTGEINAKAAGEQAALKVQADKIRLEGQYGSQVTHTLQQQISYMQQLAAYDHQSRQDKIDAAQSQLADAQAIAASVAGTEKQIEADEKVAELKAEIAKLSQEDANASQSAANAAAKEKLDKSAGGQLANTINSAPGRLGGALASGIVDGKGIGKDIRDSLKGIGKEMLGEVFSGIITAMIGNTVATVANTAGTELNTLFLELSSALFGFADGTNSAPGGMAWVGEKGPELMNVPRGAQIIPNHAIKGYADGVGLSSSVSTSSSSSSFSMGNLSVHLHGNQGGQAVVDHVLRNLPGALKARSSKFSPNSK